MSSKYTPLIAAAVMAAVAFGLGSRAIARSTEQKPGAKSPATSEPQPPGQPESPDMGGPTLELPGEPKEPREPLGETEKPERRLPVLIGVVVAVPIPSSDVALPRGAKYDEEISRADDMRSTLAAVTEAAFSKVGQADLVGLLVDMDRNRLAGFGERPLPALEARLSQLNEAWQEKYGQHFDIAENAVYGPLAYAQGEITDAKKFIQRWPVGVAAGGVGGKAKEKKLTEQVKTQGNIEKGREFAVARFPAEFGLPAVNISFIDEAFGLKLDLPDHLGGEQLSTRLLEQLTRFAERSDEWPVGVLDAYRLASHHVALALYGIEPAPRVSAR